MLIQAIIRDTIAQQLERDPAEIGEQTSLEELGLESLDVIEILFVLEEKFGVDLPFNANQDGGDLDTVQDVTTMLEAALAKRQTA